MARQRGDQEDRRLRLLDVLLEVQESVPNGVTSANSSRTCTSRLPTLTLLDAEGRPHAWVKA